MDNLKAALTAGEIDQKDYYVATEKLALEHKNNLAKINAQAVVNPVASARAEVDPVQQLANQNNQKLALMQQYQQQEQAILLQSYKAGQMTYDQYIAAKQETDAQYLALRNAQETSTNKPASPHSGRFTATRARLTSCWLLRSMVFRVARPMQLPD